MLQELLLLCSDNIAGIVKKYCIFILHIQIILYFAISRRMSIAVYLQGALKQKHPL